MKLEVMPLSAYEAEAAEESVQAHSWLHKSEASLECMTPCVINK